MKHIRHIYEKVTFRQNYDEFKEYFNNKYNCNCIMYYRKAGHYLGFEYNDMIDKDLLDKLCRDFSDYDYTIELNSGNNYKRSTMRFAIGLVDDEFLENVRIEMTAKKYNM